MIEITAKAIQAVAEYTKDKEEMPIRIYLKMGGCGMYSFGVAMEKAKPSDEEIHIAGHTYIIEPRLLRKYSPIKLDSDGLSFRISGKGVHPPTGCGTCAYGCGSRGGSRCSGVCRTCSTPCQSGQRLRARRKNVSKIRQTAEPLPAI